MPTRKGYVVLTLRFWTEGKRWVGECVELGTSTFGRTLTQADAELKELVLLHLNALQEAGERERFFRKRQIPFYTDSPPTEVLSAMAVDAEVFTHVHQFPITLPA